MIWPPVKAWTSILTVEGQRHFVAIDYGGKLNKKWIVFMSVIDSSVVVKIFWSQFIDPSQWLPGWIEAKSIDSSRGVNVDNLKNIDYVYPSIDSGLTIPITVDKVRPWFD